MKVKTETRELIVFGGSTFPAEDWLVDLLRHEREKERRELHRRHEPRCRLHPAELEDGHTD